MMDTNLSEFLNEKNIKVVHFDRQPENLTDIVEEHCKTKVSFVDEFESRVIDSKFQVLHEHSDIEARYIKGGSATFIFDGGDVYHEVTLNKDDLIVIPPNVPHCLKSDPNAYFNVKRFFTKENGWSAILTMKYDLANELKSSPKIVEKIQKCDKYAQHVYATLCNNVFYKLKNLEYDFHAPWQISWRSAGGLVAEIRINNETYLDWYCSGNEGSVHYEFIDDLNYIGWDVYVEDDHR